MKVIAGGGGNSNEAGQKPLVPSIQIGIEEGAARACGEPTGCGVRATGSGPDPTRGGPPMGSEGHGEVGTGEATCRYGRGGELLARGGWPVGRRQVALKGLASTGF